MKTASSLKTKSETPKTPGGISKSLLTPCRRVGLSRNWKKTVASPFNSPLTSSEVKQDVVKTRKRKETLEETPKGSENVCETENTGTPTRKVELPHRKKSKILLDTIAKTTEDDCSQPKPVDAEGEENTNDLKGKSEEIITCTPMRLKSKSREKPIKVIADNNSEEAKVVSTPVRLKSVSKSKKLSSKNTVTVNDSEIDTKADNEIIEKENIECNKITDGESETNTGKKTRKDTIDMNECKIKEKKEISPNKLTKECIVVIQKKIFKKQINENKITEVENDKLKQTSQSLFNDSDSDDLPLNCLNKTEKCETICINDDDVFANKPKFKKTNSTKTIKEKPSTKTKSSKENKTIVQLDNPSQNLIDDDDDFFEKKKTILIRKSYEKVIKPLKAKSTGSITQKDIEDLKARIETKKKMLLAQSLTDTKELRELIKKWQKGCQDALMELMDLMKNKCPDQNMQYSQILQTLKIPANLVGYDSDNDCFVTPEDENIILSHIKE